MISHLRGTVSGVAPDGAVIEVGGVGLSVQCTPGTLATLRPGEPARVATCLVVREDSLGDRIGARMRSRLFEMCRTVEVYAPDFRREVRQTGRARA